MSLCLSGCPVGAELDRPERYDPAITTPVFPQGAVTTTGGGGCTDVDTAMETCKGTICHGSPGVAPAITLGGGLDLFAADRETALVGAPATYVGVADPENCPTTPELLIDPANPDASLILTKVNGTYSCGAAMPVTFPERFTDVERMCLTEWVHALAGSPSAASVLGVAPETGNGGSSSF